MFKGISMALATLSIVPMLAIADTGEFYTSDNAQMSEDSEVTPMARRRYVCYAENRRGQFFRAVGRRPRVVQRRAMNQCFRYSRYCRPRGCRVIW